MSNYDSYVPFKQGDVEFESLVELMGGRDMLYMTINASDFEPTQSWNKIDYGLRFSFDSNAEGSYRRVVKFFPQSYPAATYDHVFNFDLKMQFYNSFGFPDLNALTMDVYCKSLLIPFFELHSQRVISPW